MPSSDPGDDVADRSPLLTLNEAAQFLGVSKTQLYRLARAGQIELLRVGQRSTRVTQASLDSYVKNAKRVGRSPSC